MDNNYDPVARSYDFLSRLVFGQAEVNAQVELIKYINLRSMYISARLICGIEGRELVDMEPFFATAGYSQLFTSFHYRRFIKSIVYQKNYDTYTSSPLNTRPNRQK